MNLRSLGCHAINYCLGHFVEVGGKEVAGRKRLVSTYTRADTANGSFSECTGPDGASLHGPYDVACSKTLLGCAGNQADPDNFQPPSTACLLFLAQKVRQVHGL